MREGRQPREGDDVDPPLYCTDEFRIYYMKVLPCSKRYCHDWTTCPFAHPGEKARRRDPRVSSYTGIACPDMKKDGVCVRGELCPYAHNVFEYWLHPTRYRTQLCNDGTNCKRRVCFFAHTLGELRVPSSKPFVNPQALAAAAAAAGARRASLSTEQAMSDLARLRSGQGVADSAGAADLARRLASLQVGQQLAVQHQQAQAQLQQQAQAHSDQNAVLMQLLTTLLAQKEAAAQQQQMPQQLPPGLEGQVPSTEALAALYQQLSAGGPQALPMADLGYGQQLSEQDQAALLASLDPGYAAQLLGGKGGAPQHPTPRSSLDVMAFGRSEYSTPRTSFEVPQGRTPRSSFDMSAYAASRSSMDSGRTRVSFDSVGSGRPPTGARTSGFLQDVAEGEPAHHTGLNVNAAAFEVPSAAAAAAGSPSAPMAFGPGGAYFLTGASALSTGPAGDAAAAGYGLAGGDGIVGAASQRSASLPAYLPKAFNAAPYAANMPGLDEGVAYGSGGEPRRGSCDFVSLRAPSNDLPPKAPASRRFSMDSCTRPQASTNEAYPHHLMGALPGSFNYATLSDTAAGRAASGSPGFMTSQTEFGGGGHNFGGGQAFAGQDLISNGLARTSNSSAGSEPMSSSLFANAPPTTTPEGQMRSTSLGALNEPTPVSRPASGHGSGAGSPHHNIWSPQL